MFPGAENPARAVLSNAFSRKGNVGLANGNMNFGNAPMPSQQGNFQVASSKKPQSGYVKLNSDQSKIFSFYMRMKNAEKVLSQPKYAKALQDQKCNILSNFGSLGRYLNTPEYKIAKNAADDWINAMLRRDSGAQISASEYANYVPIFIPLPNGGPELLKRKKQSRENYMFSLKKTLPLYYQKLSDQSFQGQADQGQANQGQANPKMPPPPIPESFSPSKMPPPPIPKQNIGKSGMSDAELLKTLGLK